MAVAPSTSAVSPPATMAGLRPREASAESTLTLASPCPDLYPRTARYQCPDLYLQCLDLYHQCPDMHPRTTLVVSALICTVRALTELYSRTPRQHVTAPAPVAA
eukprot:2765568-Rhodomonas_salina.1